MREGRRRDTESETTKDTGELLLTIPSFQRNLPSRGFRPAVLLGIMGAAMGYGWYKVAVGVREQQYVHSALSKF